MKREFSAGGIVFNKKGEVLLTKHSQNHHWSFPKGLIDPGQTFQEAAVREVKEEGGVEAKILEKVGYSKFIYTFEDEKIFKVVTYFLMEYLNGDVKNHDFEMVKVEWWTEEKVKKELTYRSDKEAFKEALKIKLQIKPL